MKKFYKKVVQYFHQGLTLQKGDDFGYYRNAKIIEYAEYAPQQGIKGMYDFMAQLAPEKEKKYIRKLPICLLCILHELGHHFTNITEEEYEEYLDEVEIINKKLEECTTQEEKDEVTSLYRNLSLEKLADEWAVNFAIKNKNLIKSWCDFGKKFL